MDSDGTQDGGDTARLKIRNCVRARCSATRDRQDQDMDGHMADLEEIATLRHIASGVNFDQHSRPTHRRRSSHALRSFSVNVDAIDEPVEEAGQAGEVLNFFRQINREAHLRKLKRMGNNGVRGCSGFLRRLLGSSPRPPSSRGRRPNLAAPAPPRSSSPCQTAPPKTDDATSPGCPTSHYRIPITTNGSTGGESLEDDVDPDEEDVEDDAEEELSIQKNKIRDLGELPALDWTNTSSKLLFCTAVCGSIVLAAQSGWVKGCIEAGNLCLREWLNVAAVAVGAYFFIEICAKILATFFKWTRLLHTNNKVWIFTKLHKDVSLLVWSAMMLNFSWFPTTKQGFYDGGAVGQIITCFVAFTSVRLINEVCKVEMAHQYMWKPYLERARASIWSQYVIFMLTDFCLGIQTKDSEGQALALGFTNAKKTDEEMSLYTVSKAIVFVHNNALRHPLGAGRPGTDKDGIIENKLGARLFGGLLYDALMNCVHEGEQMNRADTTASAARQPESLTNAQLKRRAPSVSAAPMPARMRVPNLPRPPGYKQGTLQGTSASSPPPASKAKQQEHRRSYSRELSHVERNYDDEEDEEAEDRKGAGRWGAIQRDEEGHHRERGTETAEQPQHHHHQQQHQQHQHHHHHQQQQLRLGDGAFAIHEATAGITARSTAAAASTTAIAKMTMKPASTPQRPSPLLPTPDLPPPLRISVNGITCTDVSRRSISTAAISMPPSLAAAPTAATATSAISTVARGTSCSPTVCERGQPHQVGVSPSAGLRGGTADEGMRSARNHRREGGAGSLDTGVTLGILRTLTSKAMALKIMELFEVPPDDVVSRKIFVDRVVEIFETRRSLQLTLGDYEAILKKVGYVLNVVAAMVVIFACLRIVGYDVGNLFFTWLSLSVAFSFLFGSSASAFFESVIFVFITKAYDVGDPVYFVDDTGREDWYVVTRINMLTTVFRRWDGQATLIANNIMAKKAIRNQWRSGPFMHYTTIAISADTPMEKLELMKAGMAAGMRRGRHRNRHGEGGLMPDTVGYNVKGLTNGNCVTVFVNCLQRENSADMNRRWGNAHIFNKLLVRECVRHGISYTLPPQPLTLPAGEAQALRVREAFLG